MSFLGHGCSWPTSSAYSYMMGSVGKAPLREPPKDLGPCGESRLLAGHPGRPSSVPPLPLVLPHWGFRGQWPAPPGGAVSHGSRPVTHPEARGPDAPSSPEAWSWDVDGRPPHNVLCLQGAACVCLLPCRLCTEWTPSALTAPSILTGSPTPGPTSSKTTPTPGSTTGPPLPSTSPASSPTSAGRPLTTPESTSTWTSSVSTSTVTPGTSPHITMSTSGVTPSHLIRCCFLNETYYAPGKQALRSDSAAQAGGALGSRCLGVTQRSALTAFLGSWVLGLGGCLHGRPHVLQPQIGAVGAVGFFLVASGGASLSARGGVSTGLSPCRRAGVQWHAWRHVLLRELLAGMHA